MNIPRYTVCCCSCSIRTGTLILGWLGLIGSSLTLLDQSLDIVRGAKHGFADTILNLVFVILETVFTVVLLMGVYKENVDYLRIAVLYKYLGFALMLIVAVLNILLGVLTLNIIHVIVILIVLAVYAYFVLIIRSHWKDVEEGNTYSSGYQV